jgi:hypothetical protein
LLPIASLSAEATELKRGDQFLGMFARVDGADRLSDSTVGAYHIGDALGILSRRRIARAICKPYLSFCVAKEQERKAKLFGKSLVLFLRVKADAKYLRILLFILLDSITESDAFNRSARCVCFRIKPEHNTTPFEIAQAYVLACVRSHGEIGCFVSYA